MQNMAHSNAAPSEVSRHQQTAMTIERFSLRAHQANARLRCGFEQAIEAGAKSGLRGHRFVIGDAVAIKAVVARPAAERIAIAQ